MSITLNPLDESIDVTFTVSKELRPYAEALYRDTKKDGESVANFVLRLLKEASLKHVAQTELKNIEAIKQQEFQMSQKSLGAEIEELYKIL